MKFELVFIKGAVWNHLYINKEQWNRGSDLILNWYFQDFIPPTLVLFTLNIPTRDLFPVEGRIWAYNLFDFGWETYRDVSSLPVLHHTALRQKQQKGKFLSLISNKLGMT